MSTDFPTNGKGTLTSEEVSNHPVMPWWMPVTPEATDYQYRNIDMVAVSYACDHDRVAALVPAELELLAVPGLDGQNPVNLIFAKYRGNDQIGPYNETIVAIPVLHKGVPFLYVAAIYVDTDAAMAAGREFGGYPKKIADIDMYSYGDLFLNRLSRGNFQSKTASPRFSDIASSKVTRGNQLFTVPLPADEIEQLPAPYNLLLPMPPATGKPQSYVLPTIGLRTVPGVGKEAARASVHQLIGTPWIITEARVWEGLDPSIDLIPSEEDPIARALPANQVLGAFILRGDMHTNVKDWMLLEDYLAR